jgi:hypothetical protein
MEAIYLFTNLKLFQILVIFKLERETLKNVLTKLTRFFKAFYFRFFLYGKS